MGWNIGKAFTRAVGIPDKQASLFLYTNPVGLSLVGTSLLANAFTGGSRSQVHAQQRQQPYYPQGPGQGNIPQPYGPSYGGFYEPNYQAAPPFQPYEVPSWGYSTPSTPYFQPQYQTYLTSSDQGSRPPWEDLASLALLTL